MNRSPGPPAQLIDRLSSVLRRSPRWPSILVAMIIAMSEVVTLGMNTVNSLVWWGRIDRDLLLIGTIDAFVAAALIGPLAVLLIRRAFDLEELNQRLATQMEERARADEERRALTGRLQQAERMEALGMLAGGVAHDLNNILTGLVGYPDWLLMQVPADSPLRQPLATIKESGERAAAVVQDLLTLARRGVKSDTVLTLNDVATSYFGSLEFSRLAAAHPDVSIDRSLSPDPVPVRASSVHLGKSLMNLVTNACEAIKGAGRVVVETDHAFVDTPIQAYEPIPAGHYALLTVRDSGGGIAPGDLPRIFEPFYTKKAMGRSGTGLGLAVVWGSVKDHDGFIDVTSAPGEGTVFRLFLPATTDPAAVAPGPADEATYRGRGETVLVVDDVAEQRALAAGILTHLGYAAWVVAGGREAVEYLREHTVDLVVLDMIMDPGPDGLDTYTRIAEIHPGQRAVIASGFSETGRVRDAMALGAGTYLRKPFTAERLGRAVRTELDRPRRGA